MGSGNSNRWLQHTGRGAPRSAWKNHWAARPQLRVRDNFDANQVVLTDTNAADHKKPIPAYPDTEAEQLSKLLEGARARRDKLRGAGIAVDHLDREILELRRQLREGGQLRAGDALSDGRYLLVRVVGRGGFAVVWEAYDCAAQQRVAIKVLHSNLAGDPLRRARFFRGARAMMNLDHPALVRVLRPREEDGGFYYFVMEFVHGGDLRDAVLRGHLQRDELLPLMLQVGEPLATAHARGMIHRDVKPSNILLDQNGQAKLTDFDLVGAHDTTGGTRTGVLGTFVYAAPECLERPQDVTARADVYGLGMTIIFCLSGHELSPSTFRDSSPTIAKLDYPAEIRRIIRKAVAWEAQERFSDVALMVAELRNALSFPVQAELEFGQQQPTRIYNGLADGDASAHIDEYELLEFDEIPSQYKLGATRQRLLTYFVWGLVALSVATGVSPLVVPPIIASMREVTPITGSGSVRVVSVPTGANVTFDGTLLGDRTPVTIDGAPGGTSHKIVVSLRHYQPYTEEVSIPKAGGPVQVMAHLMSQLGQIAVDSRPRGAQIVINGQPLGTTPTTLSGIDIASTSSIQLLHKDFGKYTVPLKWDASGVAHVDYEFSP